MTVNNERILFEYGENNIVCLKKGFIDMRQYTAVVEHCQETNLFVGYIPGFPGAHSQGATLDELAANMREVVAMLLEEGEPRLEGEFVGTQSVVVA